MFDKNTNNKTIYEYAFIGNPNRKYNFPLNAMLISGEMDFYKFIQNGKKYDSNGAFLIITEQQYIIGINAWDGAGSHNYSHARVNLELNNHHPETLTLTQIAQEAIDLEKNFIVIDFEYATRQYEQTIKEIRVYLPRKKISQFELQSFENFYNEYQEAIKFGEFPVSYRIKNSEGKNEWYLLNDIDELLTFFKNNVDEVITEKQATNESIIGIQTQNNQKRM